MRDHIKRLIPVILLAALGIGVSIAIDIVHQRLTADVNYTSFCNVNATVNCDVVLGSRYAELFAIPISRWALLYYLTVIGAGTATAAVGSAKLRATLSTAILLLAVWGL